MKRIQTDEHLSARRVPLLLLSLLPLVVAFPAVARTPLPPPMPAHCRARCGSAPARAAACLEECRQRWQAQSWREKLRLELPAAVSCLAAEGTCMSGRPAERRSRCLPALRSCVWAKLGLRPVAMRACWAGFRRREASCAGHQGRAGWECRNEARVALHRCRLAAGRFGSYTEAYRVLAAIDEEMGNE